MAMHIESANMMLFLRLNWIPHRISSSATILFNFLLVLPNILFSITFWLFDNYVLAFYHNFMLKTKLTALVN